MNFVTCPDHPSCPLDRVDPDLKAQRHAYCLECILQYENANSIYKKLPTLTDFLKNITSVFEKNRSKVNLSSTPDRKYYQILKGKDEALKKFLENLARQEEYINAFYYGLKTTIIEVVEENHQKAIQQVHEQVKNLKKLYEDFEMNLNNAYLSYEEVEVMFPSLESLNKSLQGINEAPKLEELIQSLKERLSLDEDEVLALETDDFKKDFFGFFMGVLQQEGEKKPEPKFKYFSDTRAKEEAKACLDNFFKDMFHLENKVNPDIRVHMAQNNADNMFNNLLLPKEVPKNNFGNIINNLEMTVIMGWVPRRLRVLTPKLIYQGSRDGMTPKRFHQLCDGKGPTITLIECIFEGSNEPTKIGGFLDQSWHSEGYIYSEEAFLFSVTAKVQCPLVQKGKAAYGRPAYGPRFCGDGPDDLYVFEDGTRSSLEPSKYKGSAKLINSRKYPGAGKITFEIIDIEVFKFE